MLNATLLSRLAPDPFFINSNTLYKPTPSQTDMSLRHRCSTTFFRPLMTLDEMQEFDRNDALRQYLEHEKASFAQSVVSEKSMVLHNPSAALSPYEVQLRQLIAHILVTIFPRMYIFGAEQAEQQLTEDAQQKAVAKVFDKLHAKYGPSPLENVPSVEFLNQKKAAIKRPNLDDILAVRTSAMNDGL